MSHFFKMCIKKPKNLIYLWPKDAKMKIPQFFIILLRFQLFFLLPEDNVLLLYQFRSFDLSEGTFPWKRSMKVSKWGIWLLENPLKISKIIWNWKISEFYLICKRCQIKMQKFESLSRFCQKIRYKIVRPKL